MKTRFAINALRYQLEHPLTSHDDSDLFPTNSQRPTQTHLVRSSILDVRMPECDEADKCVCV